jgi:hypothetical protein
MQRTDPPTGSAESEMSRTESEGQARPLFLLGEKHLPSQNDCARAARAAYA